MNFQLKKIIIAGEGGQGVQVIAKILQRAAFLKGMQTLYVPNFGVEQRGGVSIAFLQISKNKIYYPKFTQADIAAVLSGRATDRVKRYLDISTKIIYNSSMVDDFGEKYKNTHSVDAINIAVKQFSPKVFNIIILGEIVKHYLDFLDINNLIKAMDIELGHKFKNNKKLREENLKALQYSFNEL